MRIPKFEEDIKNDTEFMKALQNREFAVDVYRALSNMKWKNTENPDQEYSCTWRYAGGLVARLRGQKEEYIDYYCSGGEGFVSPAVEKIFNRLGWEQSPWDLL